MFWILILLTAAILVGLGAVFLTKKIIRLFPRSDTGKSASRKMAAAAVAAQAVGFALLSCVAGLMNAMVIFLHLVLIGLLCSLAAKLLKKTGILSVSPRAETAAVLLFTALWLLAGWRNAVNVRETSYLLETDGKIGAEPFRIVGFSDSHVGTLFHGEELRKYVDLMNEKAPDLVFIAGDFVDDGTTREDMLDACEELGRLQADCGVFYVYGNHDRGYSENSAFTAEELEENLRKNGVQVLKDDLVRLTEHICLLGRLDKSTPRKEMKEFSELYGEDDYLIVLDHQPGDYAAEAEAGAGLVISGHTHGGQFFPIRKAGEWLKVNDRTYGRERRGATDFIVSSGIADWELAFKTGCFSEYVVIEIS